MVHFSYLTCLLILWFSLRLVCKVTMTPQDNIAPIPTNLKVALKPGLINVTWDCNISKSMENYSYKILLPKGIQQPIDLHNCFIEINSFEKNELILHNGLEVGLLTCKDGKKVETNWKITFTPEGKNDTAADNLSCVIYNVSVMNCSWSVGKEAPEDTQYSLELRQFEKNYKCQHYRKDSFGRQVGCVLKQHAGIIYEKFVYIQVTGSSNQTSIKFMDKHIKPNNHVTLDPPRNIMLSYNSNLLEIKWERPNTHNYEPDNCFQYDISINGEVGLNKDITGPSYTTDKYYSNEKVTVTMRVKWKSFCSENSKEWSRWSDPQIHGFNPTGFEQIHLFIILGIGTTVILILLIILCHRFRIWTKLFPRVPKPEIKMFDTLEQNKLQVEKLSENEIPFIKKDEEECICSYVTEISP